MNYFGFGLKRLRLFLILIIQNLAFKRADGVIFLSKYAARIIQNSTGNLKLLRCIPHGVDDAFRINKLLSTDEWNIRSVNPIKCLYVSNAEMYKHQWNVIEAASSLRELGWNLTLTLVGGGSGLARKLMDESISKYDPHCEFIFQHDFMPNYEISNLLSSSDIFIFASSCENLPVTLLESMASGIPIACSNRGPMPEILQDGGVYFDPLDVDSIKSALLDLFSSNAKRRAVSKRSKSLSENYTWKRCSDQTFDFIKLVFNSFNSASASDK